MTRTCTCCATFVSLLVAAMLAGPPAAGATLPDLVVSSLSNPPAARARTDNLNVSYTVKNRGSATAGISRVRLYLSRDRRRSSGDTRLAEWLLQLVPELGAGTTSSSAVTATIPKRTRLKSYFVLACADDAKAVREKREANNCRASSTKLRVKRAASPPAGKTSVQIIDRALARGLISTEKAILYETFAAFGDKRLPSPYRGDNRTVLDTQVLAEAGGSLDALSAETKSILRPFFLPPAYRGSWYELRKSGALATAPAARAADLTCDHMGADWRGVEAGPVTVWWDNVERPTDRALATSIATELSSKIWPKLTTLMQRTPPSDEDWAVNGCGGSYDVYLSPRLTQTFGSFRAVVAPILFLQSEVPTQCNGSTFNGATFMSIDSERTDHLLPLVAHEFMHAVQAAYIPCLNLKNLQEAVADWAIDYVYPDDNLEQIHAPPYFDNPRKLTEWDYPDYIFYFYLARKRTPDLVRGIFAQLGTSTSVEQAIDRGLPGGFEAVWPEFTLYNWNRVPVAFYEEWDGLVNRARTFGLDGFLTAQADEAIPMRLKGAASAVRALTLRKNPLQQQYNRLVFTDPDVRSVTVRNPFPSDSNASLQALIKVAGTWRVENWSRISRKTFCRDFAAENIQELVLVFGYSAWEEPDGFSPEGEAPIKLKDTCDLRYKILDAHFETHASGSITGDVCSLGGITSTGTRDFSGVFTTQPLPLVSKLEMKLGMLSGLVQGTTSAKWTNDVLHSCTVDAGSDPPIVACDVNTPDRVPDGGQTIGFTIDSQPESPNVSVHWFIPAAEIGFVSGGPDPDNNCFLFHLLFFVDESDEKKVYPLTTFTGTGPKTVTISGSKHFSKDLFGITQSVDYDWSYSLTFVRVDEDGNPL